jgi:NitT/TauT family transport system ATP-binding protein
MALVPVAQVGEAMTGRTQIQLRGLRVSYQKQEILCGINLDVAEGEFVSLVGKSGCGKSTLLHALAGFIPSQGQVLMPGGFGMVFQNYAVFPWLTVKGNIAFGLGRSRSAHPEADVSRILEMLGLSAQASNYPAQLSGGQVQRVALGRALAADPPVILMDEPFGALDPYTRDKMQAWLLDIWEKQHKTVLFVTHSIEEAIFLSDRVVVMGRGVLLGEFPVPFDRPRPEDLKFSASFADLKKQVVRCMEQNP